MRTLVLGGPRFLGRAVADSALVRGHDLTFFNRGRTNPDLYPEVEKLIGDRDDDLGALEGREFDVVVDTSGYFPRDVGGSCAALASAGRYCFVSSVSVYADLGAPVDESSPVAQLGDLPDDEITNESYGALKALCESAVADAFGDRALIVRPGLIAGPHDPTGRFTYWPHRVARGGEVLAPGPHDGPLQAIDVRDLGGWIVESCENGLAGVFNASHPGFTWAELLEACQAVTEAESEITWVPSDFLAEQDVGEWMELPLWLVAPAMAYGHRVSVDRACDAGLTLRPLSETVRGALEDAERTEQAGLAPEREAELLAAWHGRE